LFWSAQKLVEETNMTNGSIRSYIVVASAAAILSGAITSYVRTSNAQPAPAPPAQLLTQPMADLPGREVRISLLDRAPQASSLPHRHPGHHTFGYVLEGTYEFAVDGGSPRTLKAGEVFYEPPGALHSVSRNPSADQRTKILVFMVADQKKPSTVAE
jgi:quercetin dioxygenase-like cupin family protein